MPSTYTLSELRAAARREWGLRGAEALQASDWVALANRAIGQIWYPMVKDSVSGYGKGVSTINATAGTGHVDAPATHLRTLLLQRPTTGTTGNRQNATLTTAEVWYEEHPDDAAGEASLPGVYWYLEDEIHLRPVPVVVEVIRIVFAKAPLRLASDGDAIDLVTGWEDAVIAYMASYALQDQSKRQQARTYAEQCVAQQIENWGHRRDRGPNYLSNYTKRARRGVFR